MTEAERIWSEKSDEDLIDAAANLGEFTPDGQRIVRAELKRRGLEDPLEQAGEDGDERRRRGTAGRRVPSVQREPAAAGPGRPRRRAARRSMGGLQPC